MAFSPAQKALWRKKNSATLSAYTASWKSAHPKGSKAHEIVQALTAAKSAAMGKATPADFRAWFATPGDDLNELIQLRALALKVGRVASEYLMELCGGELRQKTAQRLSQWEKERQELRAHNEGMRAVRLALRELQRDAKAAARPYPLTLEDKRKRAAQQWLAKMAVPGAREAKRARDAKRGPRLTRRRAPLTAAQRVSATERDRNRRAAMSSTQREEYNRKRREARPSRATGAPRGRPRKA